MAEGGRAEPEEPERGSSRPRPPSARDLQVRRPGARRRAGGAGQSHWVPHLSLAGTLSDENDGWGLSGRRAAGWWAWNPERAAHRAAVGNVILRGGLGGSRLMLPDCWRIPMAIA